MARSLCTHQEATWIYSNPNRIISASTCKQIEGTWPTCPFSPRKTDLKHIYLKRTIISTSNQVLRIDIDIQWSHRCFGVIRSNSLSSVRLPKIDLGFSRTREEDISIVVESNDSDRSLMTFKHEGSHNVDIWYLIILWFVSDITMQGKK